MPPWIDVPQVPGAVRAAAAHNRAQAGPEGRPRDWYTLRNAASPDEAELLLYDEIGGWWGSTAEDVIAELQGVTSPNLRVRVNSPGGSVFEGIAIANALRAHPANVTVQVDSLAASIASVIAMAGDTVVMAPNSMLMIHDASGLCAGDASDMEQMAAVLDTISDNIAGAYAARAGGTVEDWRAAMRAESWYKAQDAVDAGLADEAMPAGAKPDGDDPQMRAQYDLAAYGYAGPPRPKPGPPAPREEQPGAPVALTVDIGHLLGDEVAARLRAAVTAPPVADTASAVHHTATTDTAWDGPAAVANMPNDEATLRYCHAWYEPDGDPDAKASYRFPHHKTKGGPANLAACRNGLARLEGSTIPDSEKPGVRKHLQAHLDDANKADDHAGHPDDTAPLALQVDAEPDDWAASTAHLTAPAPDPWEQATAHLTTPAAPAATDA